MTEDLKPNPRNCTTCDFNLNGVCTIPLPKFIKISAQFTEGHRSLTGSEIPASCDTFKPKKGTYTRICLNCNKPIMSGHKYTEIYSKRWIHKCCAHPDWPSKYHYEKYGLGVK
jgi:hypothetical protein